MPISARKALQHAEGFKDGISHSASPQSEGVDEQAGHYDEHYIWL